MILTQKTDLKTDNKLAFSQRHEHMCHVRVACRRNEATTQLISSSCIKTGSDDDQIWVKVVGHRHDDMLKGKHIICVSHAFCRPRDVDIFPLAGPRTTVQVVAIRSGWIESAIFVDMQGNIQYVRVRIEGLLNAIPMVNIPIDNENFPASLFVVDLADLGRNCNIVKHAKSHRAILFGVVTWWPDDGDSILKLSTCDSPACLNSATSGQHCRLPSQLIKIDGVEVLLNGQKFFIFLI